MGRKEGGGVPVRGGRPVLRGPRMGRHQYDYQGRCGARPLRHARDCPRRGERRLTTPSPAAKWGQKRTNSLSLELVSYANYFSPLRSCVPRVTCHCCQVISQCFAPVFVSIRLLITTGSVILAALHGPTREERAWVLGQGAACLNEDARRLLSTRPPSWLNKHPWFRRYRHFFSLGLAIGGPAATTGLEHFAAGAIHPLIHGYVCMYTLSTQDRPRLNWSGTGGKVRGARSPHRGNQHQHQHQGRPVHPHGDFFRPNGTQTLILSTLHLGPPIHGPLHSLKSP